MENWTIPFEKTDEYNILRHNHTLKALCVVKNNIYINDYPYKTKWTGIA